MCGIVSWVLGVGAVEVFFFFPVFIYCFARFKVGIYGVEPVRFI
jgi:hypothetical protein